MNMTEQSITNQATPDSWADRQLALIYDTVQDVLFLLNVEGDAFRFLTVNHSFLTTTGLSRHQVEGRYVHDVIPEPSLSLVLQKYRRAIAEKRTVQWEEITPYPTGVKTGVVTVTPVWDDAGICRQLVGSVHDITEEKNNQHQLEELNRQLRQLTAHLHQVREEERLSISREIHDELGQVLTALKMDLVWIRSRFPAAPAEAGTKLDHSLMLTDSVINSVRRIISELYPVLLKDLGLVEALKWQVANFQETTGITAHFTAKEMKPPPGKSIELSLYRICQEALTNIRKHARASEVQVRLAKKNGALQMSITDNGTGFTADRESYNHGFGLLGIRERSIMCGGTSAIESGPGKGTTITVSIPFN
jgi:PAS domain S-box-containing protein